MAVAAAVAAWLAVWFGFRSAQQARKSYRLALEQDRRRQPAIELCLADSHFRTDPDAGCRIYNFEGAALGRVAMRAKLVTSGKADVSSPIRCLADSPARWA